MMLKQLVSLLAYVLSLYIWVVSTYAATVLLPMTNTLFVDRLPSLIRYTRPQSRAKESQHARVCLGFY